MCIFIKNNSQYAWDKESLTVAFKAGMEHGLKLALKLIEEE